MGLTGAFSIFAEGILRRATSRSVMNKVLNDAGFYLTGRRVVWYKKNGYCPKISSRSVVPGERTGVRGKGPAGVRL
jgi:hypothetical protein